MFKLALHRRGATRILAAAAALGLLATGHGASAQPPAINHHPKIMAPRGVDNSLSLGLLKKGNGITYHNGPIMLGATQPYVIWYGNWGTDWRNNPTVKLVEQIFAEIGGSRYFNLNTTYTDASKTAVSNAVNPVQDVADTVGYVNGVSLTDAGVEAIVARNITSGAFGSTAVDPHGVYFVLTSADVRESSGFLTTYCGWHDYSTVAVANDTKYAFIGDASRNLSVCAGQTAASPNGNPAGDAMVSVIAHELEEAVTDPILNAWYDIRGYENADKCAWNFGTTSTGTTASGVTYKWNMELRAGSGHRYLIQQNWVNANGGNCLQGW